jgi:exodeoxyribonuclease VII large subunit
VPARNTRLNAFLPGEEAEPPAVVEAPTLSVSALVAVVNGTLEEPRFTDVRVRGEVSGLKVSSSGHWYFDLKDDGAVLNVAMFASDNRAVRFTLENGMELVARGRVAIYPARSALQLVARDLRPVGAGALQLAFDQLRRRLAAEGLFDAARKRRLPEHPQRVGIVTSLNAAALRDILRVATSRHPGVHLLVAPARVQGEGASLEIAAAIARLASTDCDVLIVGRGGGSAEDLWAFNEEPVVRAIVASRVPVVSAVGHESDVTLADLAADVRAATPSNAAELVVPDADELLAARDEREARLSAVVGRLVPELRQRVDDLDARGADATRRALAREREMLSVQAARLDALSPLATLARGFGVVRRDGRVVKSVAKAPPGSDVEVTLADGTLDARVVASRKKEDA